MNYTHHHYWDLAAKQLDGKSTPAEEAELALWLAANPEHEAQYQAQQVLWQVTAPVETAAVDTDAAWQKVRARLTQQAPLPATKVVPIYTRRLRVAAAAALLIGIVWLAQYILFPHLGKQVITAGGQSVAVMLPDSSQVWLNKHSKLFYDPDFDGTTRAVTLEGEAFFEVKPDARRPFIIHTARTQTRVLGTSFNLRDVESEATAELAVATGKVSFSSTKGGLRKIVTAGRGALLRGESMTAGDRANPNRWAWKSGRLVFDNQSLLEVIKDLERYYGVELQLKEAALASCRFTGSFEQEELGNVLQVLAAALQLHYRQQNTTTYTLSGQGCR